MCPFILHYYYKFYIFAFNSPPKNLAIFILISLTLFLMIFYSYGSGKWMNYFKQKLRLWIIKLLRSISLWVYQSKGILYNIRLKFYSCEAV